MLYAFLAAMSVMAPSTTFTVKERPAPRWSVYKTEIGCALMTAEVEYRLSGTKGDTFIRGNASYLNKRRSITPDLSRHVVVPDGEYIERVELTCESDREIGIMVTIGKKQIAMRIDDSLAVSLLK